MYLYPIVSNFFFLIAAFNYFLYRSYFRSFIYVLIPFTSGSFHACDEGYMCIFPFIVHKNLDYIFAILIISLTALYFVHWDDTWAPLETLLIVVFALLISIFVVLEDAGTSLLGAGIVVIASLLVPVIYWIGYAIHTSLDYPSPKFCSLNSGGKYFPKYEWGAVLAGVVLTAMAIFLFVSQSRFAYSWSWVLHSQWHILAAFGQYYICEIKAPRPFATYRVLESQLHKITPEIVNYLYHNDHLFDKRYPIKIQK